MNIKRWILIVARLAVAAIFIYSAVAKLREPWIQFAISIESFKIVPDTVLEPMARTLPWLELAAGLGVLINVLAGWAALATALMLVVFNLAGIIAYSKGLVVDCGCFGSGAADPIGPKWFAEHAAMLVLSVLVTFFCFRRPPVNPPTATSTAAKADAIA